MPEDSGIPVDRGWAWVIAFGYFCGVFCMVGTAKSFGILLPYFVNYFEVSIANAALIMGVSGVVYTLAAPICVPAGQHFSQRRVIMVGGVVGALGLTMSCLLLSIEWVIVTFGAFFGFGNACLFGNGLVMLGQYFQKYRSLANGLALTGSSIGQFVMSPLLQYLLDKYELRGTLMIVGAIYLHVVVCGALFRPITFYTKRRKVKDAKQEEMKLIEKQEQWKANQIVKQGMVKTENTCNHDDQGDGQCAENQKLSDVGEPESLRFRTTSTGSIVAEDCFDAKYQDGVMISDDNKMSCNDSCVQFIIGLLDFRVLMNFIVLLYVIVSFLIFFGYFNFIMFMPLTAASKGVDKYDTAYLVSIAGIADLVGRVVAGITGDLHYVARYKIMGALTFLCGFAILGFNLAQSYWTLGLFVGCYGFFGGGYVVINAPVLIDLVGMQVMPKALGVVLFIQGIGAAIGQPLLGAIGDLLGSFQVVNYICTVTMVSGSLLLFLYPQVKKYQEKQSKKPYEPDVELAVAS